MVHPLRGTLGGVTKSLADMPGHCGLNRIWRLYWPAGRLIVMTDTPGLGESAPPEGRGGSFWKRTACSEVIVTPDVGLKTVIWRDLSPMVSVAPFPCELTAIVAFVCARHNSGCDVWISSWSRTCLRAFRRRRPREYEELRTKISGHAKELRVEATYVSL